MVKFPKLKQGVSGQTADKHARADDDDDTVQSSGSDEDQKMQADSSGTGPRKRKNRLTKISALYDLDGDGVLDEVEQAMRDRDVDNDGDLSPEEIYELVKDQLAIRKRRGQARMLVAGLLCFVFLLAASSLGTSWAAAVLGEFVFRVSQARWALNPGVGRWDIAGGARPLHREARGMDTARSHPLIFIPPGPITTAKDVSADDGGTEGVAVMRSTATNQIAAVQSAADVFEADELSEEVIEERRLRVLAEIDADPHSHGHRRMAGCKGGRRCNGRVTFETRSMPQDRFEKVELQCSKQQNVYLKRRLQTRNTKNDW